MSTSISEISEAKSGGYVSQDMFLARGTAAESRDLETHHCAADRMVARSVKHKNCPVTRPSGFASVFVDPITRSALRDLVSIFIAFGVEELQFVLLAYGAVWRMAYHSAVRFRRWPRECSEHGSEVIRPEC